jgi:aminoglycoside phosphotransferase (APT) family kinase protein
VSTPDVRPRLAEWLAEKLPEISDLRIEGLGRVEFGHSAEMLELTIVGRVGADEHRRQVVVRLRPPSPGLLEPYDMRRQFDILRALEPTAVRAPRALWLEESGEVLGRPFYVMERVDGQVYERELPPELQQAPERVARMSARIFDQIAAMHTIDLDITGLHLIGKGRGYVDDELDRWEGELRRWQRGPLPALEKLLQTLRERQPAASSIITLVHGDPKPGNFAFVDDEVTAVFDWELATIGDPMADIGWAEMTWRITPAFGGLPVSHFDEQLARYTERTGLAIHDREWYGAFQAFKMAVIQLVGAMLFDRGHSDDIRYADMAMGVQWLTQLGLHALGITDELRAGPVAPRRERLDEARRAATL